jgi:hypothetical protein
MPFGKRRRGTRVCQCGVGNRQLPPGPASHIGSNGISDMPRPNLHRSVTDLTDLSDRGGRIGFAKRIVHPFIDNRATIHFAEYSALLTLRPTMKSFENKTPLNNIYSSSRRRRSGRPPATRPSKYLACRLFDLSLFRSSLSSLWAGLWRCDGLRCIYHRPVAGAYGE